MLALADQAHQHRVEQVIVVNPDAEDLCERWHTSGDLQRDKFVEPQVASCSKASKTCPKQRNESASHDENEALPGLKFVSQSMMRQRFWHAVAMVSPLLLI
jgi:hypothetical protein